MAAKLENQPFNASQRISNSCFEFLEHPFPVDEDHRELMLCAAQGFAQQLNVHVYHPNGARKETRDKKSQKFLRNVICRNQRTCWRIGHGKYKKSNKNSGLMKDLISTNFSKQMENWVLYNSGMVTRQSILLKSCMAWSGVSEFRRYLFKGLSIKLFSHNSKLTYF